MASTAYAYDWNDEAAIASPRPVEPVRAADRSAAENITWHEQQLERLFTAFIGEEAVQPEIERLPLTVRIGIVLGGSCLGWAAPIALAWSLLR